MDAVKAAPSPARTKEIVGWAMYDWGNSAFATTILSAIYSVYFINSVVPGDPVKGSFYWNLANSISMILVCGTGPILGAITDYTASKKRFFVFFWLMGVLACTCLFFVHPGDVRLGFILFVVSNIGFGASVSLNNAFLTELATPDKMDRVSSFGWAMGYVGGGLCLALNLLIFRLFENNPDKTVPARLGFVLVGLWWFVFSLPAVFWLKERATPKPRPAGVGLLALGMGDVLRTIRNLRRYRELFVFLLAFLCFNQGIETVISNAAPFGNTVAGMSEREIIVCYLAIQVVAAVGAFLFGRFAERAGSKRVIGLSLFIWLGVLAFAFFTSSRGMFWALGMAVAVVLGGTQALARGFFAQLTPPAKSAEFFGFFAIGGRAAAALGSLLFGTATQLAGHMKWGIVSLAVFFVAGMILLAKVDDRAGRAAAAAPLSGAPGVEGA
jgi:UMF1 family MFS transporter